MPQNRTLDFAGFPVLDKNYPSPGNPSVVDDFFSMLDGDRNIGLDPYYHRCTDNATSEMWYVYPSECGDLSQLHPGVEVLGNLNFPSGLYDATIPPTALYPGNRISLGEGHDSRLYSGVGMCTSSHQSTTIPSFASCPPSPIPTLSCGSWSPSPSWYSALTTDIANPIALNHVAPHWEELDLNLPSFLPAEVQSGLSVSHLPPPCIMSGQEHVAKVQDPNLDPCNLDPRILFPPNPFPDVTSPRTPLPASARSSVGPQRTANCEKKTGKRNAVRSTKKTYGVGEGRRKDNWDVILVHFRARLREIVQNGQSPQNFAPKKDLVSKIVRLVREELKRSPLHDAKAGEGKRPRNVEDYLTGILREIILVELTLIPRREGSEGTNMKVVVFARLADMLEARLVAVNQHVALRRLSDGPQPGKGPHLEQTEGRVKKNRWERMKRNAERCHLERISYLFKVEDPQSTWTRVDVLSFAVVFLLCGPDAFSSDFVEAVSD